MISFQTRPLPAIFSPLITTFIIGLLLVACSEETAPVQTQRQNPLSSCDDSPINNTSNGNTIPTSLPYIIVSKYPHSHTAFTQGLDYRDGILYESTGLYGQSRLTARKLEQSEIQHTLDISLDSRYFAEGATLFGNEIMQLTWKSGKVFRYRLSDFSLIEELTIDGEGWGITHNKQHIITSNGSNTLTFRSPETLAPAHELQVSFANRPLKKINELEWAGSCLLTNIWYNDSIAVIHPDTGVTVYTIDLLKLAAAEKRINPDHVSNGIAYRDDNGHLLVTGKNWQWVYEIKLTTP